MLTLSSLRSCSLVLAPFKTFLRLNGIDDIRDDSAAHWHRNSLLGTTCTFLPESLSLPAVIIVMVTANHIDLTAQVSRLLIKVGLVQGITHVGQRAVTVTLHVFSDNSRMILLGLLYHYLVFLGAYVIRLDHAQLLLHGVPLLSDHLWRNHVFGATRFLARAILTARELTVLRHTDRMLIQ